MWPGNSAILLWMWPGMWLCKYQTTLWNLCWGKKVLIEKKRECSDRNVYVKSVLDKMRAISDNTMLTYMIKMIILSFFYLYIVLALPWFQFWVFIGWAHLVENVYNLFKRARFYCDVDVFRLTSRVMYERLICLVGLFECCLNKFCTALQCVVLC